MEVTLNTKAGVVKRMNDTSSHALVLHEVFAMLTYVQTTGKKLGKIAKQLQWHVLQSRLDIEQTRLLVLNAAHQLDLHGNKIAKGAIAMAKVKHRPTSYILCSNCTAAESTLCPLIYSSPLIFWEYLFVSHS